eukprot:CAMPEP_0113483922 /NCGR_PEP_ID=MMETSP0014_2-20120614/23687_1 /TAXON_ID=2857 /ORGANISM="Nitzschia sp." /LENGTH=462 /DNA_ID=CAMNT_0000377491 /DNA_START=325 /DNA_END=1713 /DNA_ORIENTATION=- /assembly_acc=CAM_ASM_000159
MTTASMCGGGGVGGPFYSCGQNALVGVGDHDIHNNTGGSGSGSGGGSLFDISARLRRHLLQTKKSRRVGFHKRIARSDEDGEGDQDDDDDDDDSISYAGPKAMMSTGLMIDDDPDDPRTENRTNSDEVRCSVVEIMRIPDDCRPNYWLSREDYARIRTECEQEARRAVQSAKNTTTTTTENENKKIETGTETKTETDGKNSSNIVESDVDENDHHPKEQEIASPTLPSSPSSVVSFNGGTAAAIDSGGGGGGGNINAKEEKKEEEFPDLMLTTSSFGSCGGWAMAMECLGESDETEQQKQAEGAGASRKAAAVTSSSPTNTTIVTIPRGLESYFASFATTNGTKTRMYNTNIYSSSSATASGVVTSTTSSARSQHNLYNDNYNYSGNNGNGGGILPSLSSLSLLQRRRESIWIVLEEQEFQRGVMYSSPDDIADVYMDVTRQSKYDARQRARLDELELEMER